MSSACPGRTSGGGVGGSPGPPAAPGAATAQTYGKMVRGRSGLYSQLNAGKRSVLLDLRQAADVARLLDLAAACDIVIENFRPGILDGYGAGWAELSAVNPRLIMLS